MRTIFVAPKGSPLLDQAQTYAKDARPFITFVGVTNDPTAARQRLMDGDVDLVVSFPDDPLSTVLSGQQASIRVIHTRLDPIQRTAISFASRLAIDQINGQILAQIVEGGQGLARPASEAFSLATGAIHRSIKRSAARTRHGWTRRSPIWTTPPLGSHCRRGR